jgi:hypothetical protein
MGLISPRNRGYVGGLTKLRFDGQVSDLNLTINGVRFHAEEGDSGPSDTFTVDFNGIAPDANLALGLSYREENGDMKADSLVVRKPRHDLGGMGATVIRVDNIVNGVYLSGVLLTGGRISIVSINSAIRDTGSDFHAMRVPATITGSLFTVRMEIFPRYPILPQGRP